MPNPLFTFSAEIAKDLKPIWKYLADHGVQDRLTFDAGIMKIAGFDGSHIQIMMLDCPLENKTAIYCYLNFVDLYKLLEKLKDYSFEIITKEKKIVIRSQVGKRVRTLSLRFTTEPEAYSAFKLVLPPITTTFSIPFEFITERIEEILVIPWPLRSTLFPYSTLILSEFRKFDNAFTPTKGALFVVNSFDIIYFLSFKISEWLIFLPLAIIVPLFRNLNNLLRLMLVIWQNSLKEYSSFVILRITNSSSGFNLMICSFMVNFYLR